VRYFRSPLRGRALAGGGGGVFALCLLTLGHVASEIRQASIVLHGGPSIYRNRLACGRIQCGLTQNINIALAGFRKLDDRSGDCFIREVGSAYNSRTSNFECDAHETLCLGIEPVTD
jgi:hypothetical protein